MFKIKNSLKHSYIRVCYGNTKGSNMFRNCKILSPFLLILFKIRVCEAKVSKGIDNIH